MHAWRSVAPWPDSGATRRPRRSSSRPSACSPATRAHASGRASRRSRRCTRAGTGPNQVAATRGKPRPGVPSSQGTELRPDQREAAGCWATIDSAAPGPTSRSASAMWPNVTSGTTACSPCSGVVGGATLAELLVAEPRTNRAASGTSSTTQRLQDAARWPGFEGDIDFACMSLSPSFPQGVRALWVARSAPLVPRGPARNSRGWPRGLLGARRAPARGPARGSEVKRDGSPALVHAVVKQLPRHDRVDLLHPEPPHHEVQGDAVLPARPLYELRHGFLGRACPTRDVHDVHPVVRTPPVPIPVSRHRDVVASGCVRKRDLEHPDVEGNVQADSESVLEFPEVRNRHGESPTGSPGGARPYRHGHLVAQVENPLDCHVGNHQRPQSFEELLGSVMALKGAPPTQLRGVGDPNLG